MIRRVTRMISMMIATMTRNLIQKFRNGSPSKSISRPSIY